MRVSKEILESLRSVRHPKILGRPWRKKEKDAMGIKGVRGKSGKGISIEMDRGRISHTWIGKG